VSPGTEDLGSQQNPRRSVVLRGLGVVARGARQEPLVFGAAVVGSAVYGTGTAAGGWLLGRLTDHILQPAFERGSITSHDLWVTGLALAGVSTATAIGVIGRRVAAGITMYRLQARYRQTVTRQFIRLPLSWHHQHPAGQLLSNANADVEATWQVMAPLPMALGVIVMLFVAAVAMVLADPVLAAAGLLVIPGVIVLNAVYQRYMSPAVMRAQSLRAEVSAVAHESFEAAAVVKTLGREAAESARFGESAQELRHANVRAGQLRAMFDPLIEGIPTLGILLVLVVGTWRVSTGAADTGDVVQVAYLLGLVAFPLRSLGWVLGELPRTVVGWERVRSVVEAQGEMPYGTKVLDGGSDPVGLALRGVGFAHGATPVLHDVTLDVPAGRTIAVAGPTGSGKSTLAGLLIRLVDPVTGEVDAEVGHERVDLRELRAGAVSGFAAFAGQETFVFDDTIRGNVALADEGAGPTDDEVWTALTRARADGFVKALPDGLNTRVGERGTSLSGGQRQRVALARALVRNPRLLVLDDATSAIDPRIEAEILHGLQGSGGRATVVVIAYRRATIDLADEVVYLERGRVADRGTHDELLARSEGYRALVTAYDDASERRNARAVRDAGAEDDLEELDELEGEPA